MPLGHSNDAMSLYLNAWLFRTRILAFWYSHVYCVCFSDGLIGRPRAACPLCYGYFFSSGHAANPAGRFLELVMGQSSTLTPNPYGADDTYCHWGCFSHYLPFDHLRGFTSSNCCPWIILGRSARQNSLLELTHWILHDTLHVLCYLGYIPVEVCTAEKEVITITWITTIEIKAVYRRGNSRLDM